MSDVLIEIQDHVATITLNRESKRNAFDDQLLKELYAQLKNAEADNKIRVIVLQSRGHHFSAGADIAWMKRMIQFNEEENLADAMMLAKVMKSLHFCTKPTIAVVQGAAFGGGAGLVAACDIAIASVDATFCFSEVRLGLIPAVISPYVIKAIGSKAANWLFLSAEMINAKKALELQLIQHCISPQELSSFARDYAYKITQGAPQAIQDCKTLIHEISGAPINDALIEKTAVLIAQKRVSSEAQQGLSAFLNKTKPDWIDDVTQPEQTNS